MTTSEVQDEVKPSTDDLSQRSQAAFKMEDQPRSFEFNGNDLINVKHEKTANEESVHAEGTSEN